MSNQVIGLARAYYSSSLIDFLQKDFFTIFGEITSHDQFATGDLQKKAWEEQIDIIKSEFKQFTEAHILLEYTIPRIGKRIDCVFLYKGIVFLLEFKVDSLNYTPSDLVQVTDYALDLNCFHKESHNKLLVPILVCTRARENNTAIREMQNNILEAYCCNATNIAQYISAVCNSYPRTGFLYEHWIDSMYKPSPNIIEAAQALYRGHRVESISRNDASAINLNQTNTAVNKIIDYSKVNKRKSICFITGVPGAGKTLVGLNISIERQKKDEKEHAVFLSGNGPLVGVLQEALARDYVIRNKTKKNEKKGALRKSKEFIQIIHHFRDDAIMVATPPIENVIIFDEAQRAWNSASLEKFMKNKKGLPNYKGSEPDFLISIMDRHEDWATIVCLIGGGQEINTGEAGLLEWFDVLRKSYPHWDIYLSDQIKDYEYTNGQALDKMISNLNCNIVSELHLSVSLRSFRSENVSSFVKHLLDIDLEKAKSLYLSFKHNYPIVVTRDLACAKKWIRDKAKGSRRYGLIASSGSKRLREHGIWVKSKIEAPNWFLNGKNDVRSSYFLEEAATEFDIQGLELDWAIVCWDANFRYIKEQFVACEFKGTIWQNVHNPENKQYQKNAYRVLLTRAREGFVIFIPRGDTNDQTRLPEFYDGTYDYLKSIGIEEL